MTKEIRQGLGLALIGLAVLVVGLFAGDSAAANVLRMAGVLFLAGGLVAAAVGLLRSPRGS